ncbi:MAG TPA: thioredoxin family protein [Nitrosarchaeum sp.]|nr:thioredoxin family protein [Nitrosarchaeum sp.]
MSKVSSNAFVVIPNGNGKLLGLNGSRGPSIVFFKVNGCPGCKSMLPVFMQFAQNGFASIKYLVCDLTEDRSVLQKSQKTSTPITGVPHFIFFNGERPFSILKGKKNPEELKSFINKSLSKIKDKASTASYEQPEPKNYWTPELKNVPRVSGTESEDDGNTLLTPDGITPHNTPWQSTYARLADLEQRKE